MTYKIKGKIQLGEREVFQISDMPQAHVHVCTGGSRTSLLWIPIWDSINYIVRTCIPIKGRGTCISIKGRGQGGHVRIFVHVYIYVARTIDNVLT